MMAVNRFVLITNSILFLVYNLSWMTRPSHPMKKYHVFKNNTESMIQGHNMGASLYDHRHIILPVVLYIKYKSNNTA